MLLVLGGGAAAADTLKAPHVGPEPAGQQAAVPAHGGSSGGAALRPGRCKPDVLRGTCHASHTVQQASLGYLESEGWHQVQHALSCNHLGVHNSAHPGWGYVSQSVCHILPEHFMPCLGHRDSDSRDGLDVSRKDKALSWLGKSIW